MLALKYYGLESVMLDILIRSILSHMGLSQNLTLFGVKVYG